MPSITPMMSAIFWLDDWMPFMVCTTWLTTSPPRAATLEAALASWLACWALSALVRTVPAISSTAAAVSSRLEACSSVRPLRSVLPWAICVEAVATESAPMRTVCTMVERPSIIWARACCISPISSRRSWRTDWVRSPPATALSTFTVSCTGAAMRRLTYRATTMPRTAMISTDAKMAQRAFS